jgi:photosystem II stability/assembly factor-like uncharacterized protein
MKPSIATGVLLFFGMFIHLPAFPQLDLRGELGKRLKEKKKFGEIINIVHSFYDEERSKLSEKDTVRRKYITRQIKFWNRWEWFARARLDENGEITNVNKRNWKAFQELQSASRVSTNTTNSSYAFWVPIGPTSFTRIGGGGAGGLGRVNCVAFHPTDPDVLYIGCPDGGLWRTVIGGDSWVPLSDHIPSVGISGIVVSYNNPNTIYILTGDGDISIFPNDVGVWRSSIGVLKSTDGGQNWFATSSFPNTNGDYWGYKLIQDPTNANILFAATSDGIYKTINAGSSWSRVRLGKFTDIEFKPGDHNIMYATEMDTIDNPLSISNAFYRSANNGDFWSNAGISGVPGGIVRLAIGVSANKPNDVYLLAGPAIGNGVFKGIYKSSNAGISFSLKAQTPNILGRDVNGTDNADQSWYDLAIAVNPSDAANIITGGIDVWSSNDSGVNMINRTSWVQTDVPASKYVHGDIHNLAYNPLNNKLYVCSDGGISVSADHGLSWSNLWDGLQIMEYYHLSGYDQDAIKLIGGTQDNGTNYRRNNSSHFYHILGADGYCGIIDYADSSILYFTGNESMAKSSDGGNSVLGSDLFNAPGPSDPSWPMIAMHTTDHSTVFAGKRGGIYKSTDGGYSWVNKSAGGNIALITCPSNSSRIYACYGADVNIKLYAGTQTFRSDQGGDNWIDLTVKQGYPDPATHPHLTDLAVHPGNSFRVWITLGGYTAGEKVYYSDNAGDNWINISGSLPNVPATAIAIDNNGNAYLGTDVGVFYRGATMTDWVPFYNGLPKTPVSDLVINDAAGVIVAATFGRGLFQSTLYSTCFPTLSLAGSATGSRFYEAANWITSTHDIYGGTGTEIFYRAGDYVLLENGFEVKGGSYFKGYISPCANGIPSQGIIYTNYNISMPTEILTEELVRTEDHPVSRNQEAIISSSVNNEKEINLSLISQQFVQVYFQEANTNEILLRLVRSSLPAGQYRLKYNDTKLKNGKVNLIIDIGGNKKIIAVR